MISMKKIMKILFMNKQIKTKFVFPRCFSPLNIFLFRKIVELIMAAFEGHEEPSDGEEEDEEDEDDDESLNTSTSSHRIPNEHAGLNINNNNNTMEHFSSQGKHE